MVSWGPVVSCDNVATLVDKVNGAEPTVDTAMPRPPRVAPDAQGPEGAFAALMGEGGFGW